LEDVEEGSVSGTADVYTEYPDPRRDEWATKILPALRRLRLSELAPRPASIRGPSNGYGPA
jgi:hypothetical protein